MAARLVAEDVSCGYEGVPVLEHVGFSVMPGEVCCVLGPNGVGKTTLFRTLLGTLPPISGRVLLDGRDVAGMRRVDVARKAGYVPQAHSAPFPYTVLEVVEMGRTSHLSMLSSPSREDRELSLQALNVLGVAHLHDRLYTQVSGGERQMTLIARALVQQADMLVMDEPTANLDFGNQADVLRCVRQLADAGYSVLMTTHSPDHAFRCADTVVAISGASDAAFGPVEEVLTEETLGRLYGMRVSIATVDGGDGGKTRFVVPLERDGESRRREAIAAFLRARP